ncbi:MAG: hypothetical protein E7552_04390 [Ruminococcaceae bacterium]|nr:hypothetical protein [Oscillospiraceae bacterium]
MDEKKSLKEFLVTPTGFAVLTIVLYVGTFLLMALIGSMSNWIGDGPVLSVISVIVFGFWAVWGWKGLSKIQPNIFLIMPIAGWILYFVIKGFLAIFLGVFIAPYQISKMIRRYLQKKV